MRTVLAAVISTQFGYSNAVRQRGRHDQTVLSTTTQVLVWSPQRKLFQVQSRTNKTLKKKKKTIVDFTYFFI